MDYLRGKLAEHDITLDLFEQVKETIDDKEIDVTRGKVKYPDGREKYFSMLCDFASFTTEEQQVWVNDAVAVLNRV